MAMAIDAFAALLCPIEQEPPVKQRVYRRLTILLPVCKRKGSVLDKC